MTNLNLWRLVYDTLADAQQAADWLLRGSSDAKRVLIIGVDKDVPEDLLPVICDDTLVVRARGK